MYIQEALKPLTASLTQFSIKNWPIASYISYIIQIPCPD